VDLQPADQTEHILEPARSQHLAQIDPDAIAIHPYAWGHCLEVRQEGRREHRERPGGRHRPAQDQQRIVRELRLTLDTRHDPERRHQARPRYDLGVNRVALLRPDTDRGDLRVIGETVGDQPVDQIIAERNFPGQVRAGKRPEIDAETVPDGVVDTHSRRNLH
jgi:hypothetical protein